MTALHGQALISQGLSEFALHARAILAGVRLT